MAKRNKKKNKGKKSKEKKKYEIERDNKEIKVNSNVYTNIISFNKDKIYNINLSIIENKNIEKIIDNNISNEDLKYIIMKFISINDNINENDYEKGEDNLKNPNYSDSTKENN